MFLRAKRPQRQRARRNMFLQANVPMTLAISKQSAGLQDRIQIPGNINRALYLYFTC